MKVSQFATGTKRHRALPPGRSLANREIFSPAGIGSAERSLLKSMKNLLDHFWRKRPDASTPPESQPASPPPAKTARPIATISVAPRTVRPAWQAAAGSAPGKRRAPQIEHVDAAETVTLTIGDIWDRLPADLLSSNAPDRSTPMTFDLAGLSERIGRGDPAIPVTEIAQRIPQLFRANAVIAPDRMVLFPWKAMHNLIVRSNDGTTAAIGITPGGVEALSLKVRARRLHRPSKAAPATARPTPPPGFSPRPEDARPSEPGPIILEKLALQAPTSFPVPPAAPARNNSELPAPAPAPFLNQEHERQLAAMRAERDAARARVAALDAAAASASAPAPAPPEIESCRKTIQALYAERDALRQEQQQLAARLVVAGGIVEKEAVDAAATNRPKPDAYSGLFPHRTSASPLVIVLLMVLLAYGVFNVSKLDLSQTAGLVESPSATESEQILAPVAAKVSAAPPAAPASATATILEEVIVTAPTASVAEPTATSAEPDSQTGTDPAEPESTPLD